MMELVAVVDFVVSTRIARDGAARDVDEQRGTTFVSI
jgi:hypothetical protein